MQPPNCEERVKAKEFLVFLREHGVITEESEQDTLDCEADSKVVKSQLHCGVRLLISRKESRLADREEFGDLLITQAGYFMASMPGRAEKLSSEIEDFLEQEERKTEGTPIEAASLAPVTKLSSSTMGIEKAVFSMVRGAPKWRSNSSQESPYKMTPLAEGSANMVNVGEAIGTLDDSLPTKIARLEQALTYVAFRASNRNIEQVVRYKAFCMSVVDGSSLGSVIINLNADVFPYLARLQEKGLLAYLVIWRSVFGDIDKLVDHYSGIDLRLERMQSLAIEGFALAALSLTLTFTLAWALHRRR